MQLCDENVIFRYKDTQIQYFVNDHIRFTAKNITSSFENIISIQCVKLV